jgi:uncharacterized protein
LNTYAEFVEWTGDLDPIGQVSDGRGPTPFREFILKVHSRCDLACDYCYVFTKADQRWRELPHRMSEKTVDQASARIAEHVRAHRLPTVRVVLHGGEPLLAGRDLLDYAITSVRQAVGADARVEIGVQTNGTRLDEPFLRLFDKHGVRVAVSLDGDQRAHDRHRLLAGGTGSHRAVSTALSLLSSAEFAHLFGGILCVIDLENDPVTTYEALLEFDPPAVDFLLPHANWSQPPPEGAAAYGEWLVAVFDRWYGASSRETDVRLFSEIMHLLFGGASRSEAVGLSPVGVVVVETDGMIEQSDMLRSAFEGASATGLHVERDTFDAALRLPGVMARQIGTRALSAECRACRIHGVCGGGLYPHRYRPGSGFGNPSVYCAGLFRLITHIESTVVAELSELRKRA